MKLLIITQAVDLADPVLGFFHRWIEEFASRTDHVTVITQRTGRVELPANVTVLPLGKDDGLSRPRQVLRFWRYILMHGSRYDAVLVHMTPIWLVLGWPLWALMRKRRYLWYEAKGGGRPLKISLRAAHKIFSASESGLPIMSAKHVVMGHGIEPPLPSDMERDDDLIVSVGRITPAKRLDLVLRAFAACPETARLRLVGGPMTESDHDEQGKLLALTRELGLTGRVETGPLPRDEALPLLRKAALFLHASVTGLDKAPLEAMAAGCPTVSCAEALQPFLPEACRSTPATFAVVASRIIGLPHGERQVLGQKGRSIVEHEHALSSLIDRLVSAMA